MDNNCHIPDFLMQKLVYLLVGWALWNIRFTDDIGYIPYVVTTIPFPFHECDLPSKTIYRVYNNMSNTTGTKCGAASTYLVFFFFSHDVFSLISNYEFDCPSGLFRPSFFSKGASHA